MRQLQPVLWTKGALLSPQHLQTHDRFFEDLIQFKLSSLTVDPWGFHRLEIDHEALAGNAFALAAAAGIFPDGLLFDAPAVDPLPPPRPLEGLFAPDQESLDVYLTIPEFRPGGHNVAATAGGPGGGTRYLADELLRRDENTGLAEKPIQVARKNLRLLVEGEPLEGSVVLRAARVLRAPTGELRLDPRHVPPIIDIAASDYVMAIARRLVEILSARSTTLSGMRRQKNQSLASFGISDVANFWLLYTVNTHFPQLRHLYETRRGHPAELYTAMLSLAGSLSTFSTAAHPRALPAYEHENLERSFTELDERIRELLETVVPASYVSLPLRRVQPNVYATALEQDRYLAAPQIYLALSADASPAELVQRAPQLIKITSAEHIERLIRQALPGVGLVHVPAPPSAVPVKVNFHYFELQRAGPDWEAVARARNLAAFAPAEIGNPQMELVVILPR